MAFNFYDSKFMLRYRRDSFQSKPCICTIVYNNHIREPYSSLLHGICLLGLGGAGRGKEGLG
jgi:hypothetical protein